MTEPIVTDRPAPPPGPIRPGPGAVPPDTGAGFGGGGGFLQRRSMGIPNWGWIVGGVGAGLLLLWWFRRGKQSQSDTTGGTGTTTNQTPYSMDIVGAQSSVLAQLRDLQGQASIPGPAGEQGPPGATGPAGPAGDSGTPTPVTPPTTPTPTPTAPAPVSTPQRTYVVQSGDNLNSIASRLGITWAQLYYPNQSTIDQASRAHGYPANGAGGPNSSPGWWIFPGERFVY